MKSSLRLLFFLITAALSLSFLSACSDDGNTAPDPADMWTWVAGSDTTRQPGVYGTKGTAAAANYPGARRYSVCWNDAAGTVWIFGGIGYDGSGSNGYLNDLWKFDGTRWTWVSGSSITNQASVYGTKGTADTANIPGARERSVGWMDAAGNLWLFGGLEYDGAGSTGSLNDLWKFDGTSWTWVSGSTNRDQTGTYGILGTADAANIPGARYSAAVWTDASGNFWLFGGYGYPASGSRGKLNDLWKFNGTNWTWVAGSSGINRTGTYGTQGTADAANIPGARSSAIRWTDASGNFWLFGGNGYGAGSNGYLNDLWKFDGTSWAWVSGSSGINQTGTYGTKGTADAANIPGARMAGSGCTDAAGNLWLFGGEGYPASGSTGSLNDLWKYNGTNWTWVSGSTNKNELGIYGTQGTPDTANIPGSRSGSASWFDAAGNFRLFGAYQMNDLWKYRP